MTPEEDNGTVVSKSRWYSSSSTAFGFYVAVSVSVQCSKFKFISDVGISHSWRSCRCMQCEPRIAQLQLFIVAQV